MFLAIHEVSLECRYHCGVHFTVNSSYAHTFCSFEFRVDILNTLVPYSMRVPIFERAPTPHFWIYFIYT